MYYIYMHSKRLYTLCSSINPLVHRMVYTYVDTIIRLMANHIEELIAPAPSNIMTGLILGLLIEVSPFTPVQIRF